MLRSLASGLAGAAPGFKFAAWALALATPGAGGASGFELQVLLKTEWMIVACAYFLFKSVCFICP